MKKPKRFVIILTGSSGSGKSTLARSAKNRGFAVLDADKAAHSLYKKGRPLWKAIRREFGREILASSGEIDRKKLGALVFTNSRALARLKKLAYPVLTRELRKRLSRSRRAVLDMAVYFDAGAPDFGARIVLVKAPLALRIKRLESKGLPLARARAQANSLRISKKWESRADLVLNNVSTPAALKAQFTEWLNHNP